MEIIEIENSVVQNDDIFLTKKIKNNTNKNCLFPYKLNLKTFLIILITEASLFCFLFIIYSNKHRHQKMIRKY